MMNEQLTMVFEDIVYSAIDVLTTDWTNVAWALDGTDLAIYKNGVDKLEDRWSLDNIVLDSTENSHEIGVDFIGFIYMISIKQRYILEFNITTLHSCTEYQCINCPKETCLSNCDYDQYMDPDTTE